MSERILGLDTGSVHVGVSEWADGRCISAFEMSPSGFAWAVLHDDMLRGIDIAIAEAYVPQGGYGDGSEGVDSIKLLGLFEWVAQLTHEVPVRLVTRADRKATLIRMKAAGYRFTAHGHGGHAADAEAVVIAGMRWKAAEVITAQAGV